MIWSPHSYNPETKSLGCWVMDLTECDACLDARRVPGRDLHPEELKKELDEFEKNIPRGDIDEDVNDLCNDDSDSVDSDIC